MSSLQQRQVISSRLVSLEVGGFVQVCRSSVSNEGVRISTHTDSKRVPDIVRVEDSLKITCTSDPLEVKPDLVQLLP